MLNTQNTHLKMFAEWFKSGEHPEELRLVGVSMYLKEAYREYYKGKINEKGMEIGRPVKRTRN